MKRPRMNYSQYRKSRRLTHECCNYCDGNCLLLDDGEECVCVQSISYSLLCRWFKAAVLPLDAALYAELMERSQALRCRECGTLFSPRRPNCLYCPDCAKKRKRQSKKLWARKHRACVEKVMGKGPEISGLFPLVRGVVVC